MAFTTRTQSQICLALWEENNKSKWAEKLEYENLAMFRFPESVYIYINYGLKLQYVGE